MVLEKISLKESQIKVWTPEGFKYIKNIYSVKIDAPVYKIEIDGNINLTIPDFIKVRTPRGYIKPSKLDKENDAILCHSDKNLNTLRTIDSIKKVNNIDEFILIELENFAIVRTFSIKEEKENYSCLSDEGIKTTKKLKDIKEGDYVQVGDEFKEILCKKIIDEDEGIIIINMNNNAVFINNVCVIFDIKGVKNDKKNDIN